MPGVIHLVGISFAVSAPGVTHLCARCNPSCWYQLRGLRARCSFIGLFSACLVGSMSELVSSMSELASSMSELVGSM